MHFLRLHATAPSPMNRALSTLLSLTVAAAMAAHASAQVSLTPVAGFGNNGWMAPGSIPYLTQATQTGTNTSGCPIITNARTERGLAYNPVTGNLVLVSRANVAGVGNNIRILSGATGADLGGLDPSGITGGTFPVNMCAVADDGSIYVANLAIFNATTNPTPLFKIYRWNDEVTGATTPPRAGRAAHRARMPRRCRRRSPAGSLAPTRDPAGSRGPQRAEHRRRRSPSGCDDPRAPSRRGAAVPPPCRPAAPSPSWPRS